MPKITMISSQQNSIDLESRNFTQVGGIYSTEIRPEEYLIPADIMQYALADKAEQADDKRDPRFFRVE